MDFLAHFYMKMYGDNGQNVENVHINERNSRVYWVGCFIAKGDRGRGISPKKTFCAVLGRFPPRGPQLPDNHQLELRNINQ